MSKEAQRQTVSLLHAASSSDDGVRAADGAVLVWRDIDATLSPIIGKLGFAALYLRCVALRTKSDPWLGAAHKGVNAPDDFAALHVALSRRTGYDAELAHHELLRTFHELLAALIGEPLTARLLPAWQPEAPHAPAPQDRTP